MPDTLVYCAWFGGGLRIVDIADPLVPREVGSFIPEPAAGKLAPQTNDVDVDGRGLIYIVNRYAGFDVLEFKDRNFLPVRAVQCERLRLLSGR